jgi:hypothetical protein
MTKNRSTTTSRNTKVSSDVLQLPENRGSAVDAGRSVAQNTLYPRWLREAQDAARMILRSPDFLNQFLAAVKKQGLVGEEKAALVVLIVIVSRLLKRPLNLMLKGRSASGKNFVVRKVLSLVPRTAVIEITSSSARAWNYAEDAFCHRLVLLQERNEASGAVHPMRLLISEGKLVRIVTVRENGRWVTKRFVSRGPIASISTTTKDRLEPDDESRSLSLWTDESEAQTARIVHAYGYERRLSTFERRAWREIHNLLQQRSRHEILLPRWLRRFADHVYTKDLKVRRYYPAFIEACRTVALIRSFQKGLSSGDGVTVDFIDVAITASIMGEVSAESIHKSEGQVAETRKVVEQISRSKNGAPVGRKDLVAALRISKDQAFRMLSNADGAGAIFRANKNEKSNRKLYLPTPRPRFVPDPAELFEMLTDNDVPNRVEWINPLTGKATVYTRRRFAGKR